MALRSHALVTLKVVCKLYSDVSILLRLPGQVMEKEITMRAEGDTESHG